MKNKNNKINKEIVIAIFLLFALVIFFGVNWLSKTNKIDFNFGKAADCSDTGAEIAYFEGIQGDSSPMMPGEQRSASVSFLNCTSFTWTAADGFKLASQNPANNTTWGASSVPVSGSVPRNQIATFSFTVTAPLTPGIYNFQTQMFKEGFGFFGEPSPNIAIEVKTPPQPIVELKINGSENTTTIDYNGSATISWSSSNANNCDAKTSFGFNGGISTAGSQTFSNITENQSATLTCTGPGGSTSKSVTLVVGSKPADPPPPAPIPTPAPTPTPNPPTEPKPDVEEVFTVKLVLVGDLNYDSIVNSLDYSLLNKKWFQVDALVDINTDGIVNSLDFSYLNKNWFKTADIIEVSSLAKGVGRSIRVCFEEECLVEQQEEDATIDPVTSAPLASYLRWYINGSPRGFDSQDPDFRGFMRFSSDCDRYLGYAQHYYDNVLNIVEAASISGGVPLPSDESPEQWARMMIEAMDSNQQLQLVAYYRAAVAMSVRAMESCQYEHPFATNDDVEFNFGLEPGCLRTDRGCEETFGQGTWPRPH